METSISPVYAAGITIDGPINSGNIISVSIISDTLREYLAEADENELIPVTIQLNDNINLDEAEELAITFVMERYGIKWEHKGAHEEHLSVMDYKKQERAAELEN